MTNPSDPTKPDPDGAGPDPQPPMPTDPATGKPTGQSTSDQAAALGVIAEGREREAER